MPKRKDEKKRRIFEKVGLVFRNPVRVDIVRELSSSAQRPIDLARKIGVPKQQINYHLRSLKEGGIVRVHREELPKPASKRLLGVKGVRVNGVDEEGRVQVSYGVELTRNGEVIANQIQNLLSQLVEEETVAEKGGKKEVRRKKKKEE
ncbi:MAG: helix-turn-helix domain-containing protein [Candidatus Freyrarchaeum guaymaensis]|nr:helix-turn-helix domain-containing protein [Candidatus Sigynarchaeota archaeon]